MKLLVVFLGFTTLLFSRKIPETEAMKKRIQWVDIGCPFSGRQGRFVLDAQVKIEVHKGKVTKITFKKRLHPVFEVEIVDKVKKWRFIPEKKKWNTTIHFKKTCSLFEFETKPRVYLVVCFLVRCLGRYLNGID